MERQGAGRTRTDDSETVGNAVARGGDVSEMLQGVGGNRSGGTFGAAGAVGPSPKSTMLASYAA